MSSLSRFASFKFRNRQLLPIVQGGMGVGISAHRLAGSVAKQQAIGTIASVDLRHHHPDLLEELGRTRDEETLTRANLVALDREIKSAKALSEGNGLVAVNVMKAVSAHPHYVRQACESGADAIVMGAGLPLDLPELVGEHDIALIPILSDSRGIGVILKKWMKKNRLPDAIVIESPTHAAGHLGAAKIEDLHDPRFAFKRVLEETHELFEKLGLGNNKIPLIIGGGVNHPSQVKEYLELGASAVQLGTAFAVTEEGDAHINFKKVLTEATPEDIVTFTSVAGLPARAVRTHWLNKYLQKESLLQSKAKTALDRCSTGMNCLSQCGLRDGIAKFGQFCIDLHLAAALRGEVNKGLFFRGSEKLPFGSAIRSVRDLLEYLVKELEPLTIATSPPTTVKI